MQRVSYATPLLVPFAATALAAPAHAAGQPGGEASPEDLVRSARAADAPRGEPGAEPRTYRPPQDDPDSPEARRLREGLEEILEGRILGSSTTAVYIVDAFTGDPIYERNIEEPLNPASNVKLVTTAAALDTLGPSWRYNLRLFGPVPDGGEIDGDVYLRGGADPTLAADDLATLAGDLADSGARRITGDLVLGPYRTRDAVGLAPTEVVARGGEPGEPAEVEVEPMSSFFEIENEATTVGQGGSRIRISKEEIAGEDGEVGRTVIRVRGRIREGRHSSRTLWIQDRAGFTAHTFRAALEDAGVEVQGDIRQERFSDYSARAAAEDAYLPVELARYESAPMSEIVADVNKPSSNFLADRVAMTAGAKLHGNRLSMATGLAAMDMWLERAGIDPDTMVLDTGSGLSYETEFSARQVMDVLRAASGYGASEPSALTAAGAQVAVNGTSELAQLAEAPQSEPAADLTNVDTADGHPAEPEPGIEPIWARGLGEASQSFVSSLPVAGVDGTLSSRFRRSSAREHVFAKTGTLRNIIALSGFATGSRADNRLGFAIITNDHRPGLRTAVREEQDRLVDVIYDYLRTRPRPEQDEPVVGGGPTS